MLLVNFSSSGHNCANFYPQFKFFVRQYLLHSVILVSGKAETGSHKKGGKIIMFQKKPSASEVDGVQYRRAKTWQIICYACNAFVGMSVYSLIGMAS